MSYEIIGKYKDHKEIDAPPTQRHYFYTSFPYDLKT